MKSKIFLSVLIGVFCLSFVMAAWVFEYNNTVEGEIPNGGNKLQVTTELSDFFLNVSNGNLTNTQNLTLDSSKDDTIMRVYIDVNKTLTEVGCPDYQNDCSVDFGYQNGTQLPNASYITIYKGINEYQLETICVPLSCGQNISTEITIEED